MITPQILAMYLGCQCEYMALSHDGYSWDGPYRGEIVGYTITEFVKKYYKDIKPILRPLSSMTEEEKLKLYQFGFTCNRKGLQIEEPQKWHCFKPEQFQWLLSLGFDLFNLIEQDLAIDSSKL